MTDLDRTSQGAIVITGAAGGMGTACVAAFQQQGPMILSDIDEERLEETATGFKAFGADATPLKVDVSSPDDVARLASLVATAGGLRTLVHTAGISPTMADPAKVLEVDLAGTARLTQALLPLAGTGTAVVCIASIGGQMGTPSDAVREALADPLGPDLAGRVERALGAPLDAGTAYALAKRGVIDLCEREASAWGARGARIVSISPGLIDTPMGRLEAEENEGMAFMIGLTPVTRGSRNLPGSVGDIAEAAAFLASPAAGFVSGCDLRVDGGLVAAMRHEPGLLG